jgi:hypothetical protein
MRARACDPIPVAPGQLRANLVIKTDAGRTLSFAQEHHRGSAENPISRSDVEAKFETNTAGLLSLEQQRVLRKMIDELTEIRSASSLIDSCICRRTR